MGVRHLTAKGNYKFLFDLQDGFYALGIAPSDREYFTLNIRGTLYRLCGLPMGWSLSSYYFTTFTMTFVKHLRSPTIPLRLAMSRGRAAGCAAGGLREPVQYGQYLGVEIDTATGYFHAPADKLQRLARQAKQLLQSASRDARWLPVRELQSLGGRAQYLYLAIPAARFYLRDLPDVVGSKWGGRWWTAVPTQSNGRPIHRHVETAYMHFDSSGYGWGAVLNGRLEAVGFWGAADERQHITWKALRDEWQLDPVLFEEQDAMWGAHSVDRFASAMNAMLPRYDAAWLDPGCKAVDSLHLSAAEWHRENDYCNAPLAASAGPGA
eukprot:jgi/Tetstr1/425946/TSEL_016298.t1